MPNTDQIIASLEQLILDVPEIILEIDPVLLSRKPSPDKWSKKEILGHLCDSCFNNLQRIIRVQHEEKPFIIYQQDEWVKIQHYQDMPMQDVLNLWILLHKQFVHVLKNFPKKHLKSMINWGEDATAEFVIQDYLAHQYHHLSQISEKFIKS